MNITREMIIGELIKRGYDAREVSSIKNGILLEGVQMQVPGRCIAPIIYTDAMIQSARIKDLKLDDIVGSVIAAYEESKNVKIDISKLTDRGYILKHVFVGIQPEGVENIIKKPLKEFEGIECYLYVRSDNTEQYTVKVKEGFLKRAGISEAEAWENAYMNTENETNLISMAEVMADLMGCSVDDLCEDIQEKDLGMYVLTNKCKLRGAAAVINKKVLKEFAERHNTDRIVVLPSSIHEMILIPYTDECDIDTFTKMVTEINETTVNPTERLVNRAYIVNVA